MKRFFLFNLSLMMLAAITPAAMAQGNRARTAADLNGDGVVSVQEVRVHRLDNSTK